MSPLDLRVLCILDCEPAVFGVCGVVPTLRRHTEVVSDVAESGRKKILAGFQRPDRNVLHRVALPRDPKIGNPRRP
jgi:hypothetical protein